MSAYFTQSLVSKSILLVEDDHNDVILIRRAFKKANIDIPLNVVHDGEEAIKYLSNQHPYQDINKYALPSLILLDLKLPRVTGLELLSWIRSHEKIKRILVVVLTSSQESPDVIQAYDLGANSYLVKPVNFEDLKTLMKTMYSYWFHLNQEPVIN